jgi:hypothetical protein
LRPDDKRDAGWKLFDAHGLDARMTNSQAFKDARSKAQWAKHHIYKLVDEYHALLDSDLTRLIIEDDFGPGQKRTLERFSELALQAIERFERFHFGAPYEGRGLCEPYSDQKKSGHKGPPC